MAIFDVPLTADPRQSLVVALAGEDFRLDLDWVGRQRSWSLSVRSADGDLFLGLRLVPGVRLLRRRAYREDAPDGVLIVLGALDGTPPGLDDFADASAQLLFATEDDAAALDAAGLP